MQRGDLMPANQRQAMCCARRFWHPPEPGSSGLCAFVFSGKDPGFDSLRFAQPWA
jgi:hypothetical protein